MGENAANPAPGVAVNAALEFLQETDDWATNDHTRKVVVRLYQETVGKTPPAAVTNFGWVRLRVAYEITRCYAENDGIELGQRWLDRYEAVKAWDHARYVELTGQTKVGLPGEDTQMRTVKEVKAKGTSEEQGAPSVAKRALGKTHGLSAARTWEKLLLEQARLAPSGKQLTDAELVAYVAAEFPGRPNVLHVRHARALYNEGKLSCQKGTVPVVDDQAPVPEKGPSEKKAASTAAASAVRAEASTATKNAKRIRVRKAAKATA